MRKPRDYDADLKALDAKARQLKTRKVTHLGELVIATGADTLTHEELAGALLAAVAMVKASSRNNAGTDSGPNPDVGADLFGADIGNARATWEGWRRAGAALFRGTRKSGGASVGSGSGSAAAGDPDAQSPEGTPGAN